MMVALGANANAQGAAEGGSEARPAQADETAAAAGTGGGGAVQHGLATGSGDVGTGQGAGGTQGGVESYGLSDGDESISDVDLWSDSEAGGTAEVADIDMDVRQNETEAERRTRISDFFKEKLRARAKRKQQQRRAASARDGGVRKPRGKV